MKFELNDFLESKKFLESELNKSKIDFNFTHSDVGFNVEISYPYKSNNLSKFYNIELERLCFKTGFYKFVINENNEFGPADTDNFVSSGKIIKKFILNKSFKIWDDFDKEYGILKNKISDILSLM